MTLTCIWPINAPVQPQKELSGEDG